MNKRRKILAAMLAAFLLMVPMFSMAQITVGDANPDDNLTGTWGTMQITDNNDPSKYVPLGEGLWLLAGAAGLYLLVKSRKTRKATAVAAAALALTLGTAQCKKTEESVIPAGETISISFMAGNGAKADIDVDHGRITWETNDEVYVVYNGQLLSQTSLKATPDTENPVNASISGTITTTVEIKEDNPSFTFYYVGSGVTFDKTNFTFDISSQDGVNAGHYMVGRTGAVAMTEKEDGTYGPQDPGAKHFAPLTSVLRLNTSGFESDDDHTTMTMSGGNSKMKINLADPETITYTPGYITFTSGEDVRISVIPTTAGNATLIFSGNGKVGSITVKNGIQPDHIYSKVINNAGSPIPVEAAAVPDDALPGLFTVSDTKKVFFSNGNLQYVKSSQTWRFAANQWETVETAGQNVGNNYASADVQTLFGWGDVTPLRTSENNSDYSTWTDWGKKIGDGNTWRTLTSNTNGEWDYLLTKRTMINGKPHYTNMMEGITIGSTIYKGLFIYPDDYNGNEVGNGGPSTWDDINNAGIVFLPAAGFREGASVKSVGLHVAYWSSSYDNSDLAYSLDLTDVVHLNQNYNRYFGFSVRLVFEVPAER